MMIVETETPRFVEGMRARFFDHLSRSTRLDRSADDLVVLLHVLMVDDHIVGPAFGPLGEADAECTPLARMREYALSELRLPQGAV